MKSTAILHIFFIVLTPLFATQLMAQPDSISLEKAINKAIENNPEMNQLRSQYQRKAEEWRTATGIFSPEFTYFKEGLNDNDNKAFEEQRIAITQGIDFPLTSYYRLQKIKKEKQALKMQVEAHKRNLKAAIKTQYIKLLYALYYQDLMQEQLELAQNLANAVQTRAASGAGNGMDKLKAEIKLAQAKNDIDQAVRILHNARYGLFRKMGIDEEEQAYSIRFADTLRTRESQISQDTALNYVTRHPSYLAGLKQKNAAVLGVKEAKSNFLPDINFSYYQQDYDDGAGYDFTGFEVGISIPLWFPLNQKGGVQRAKARKAQREWQHKGIELEMKKQIEMAWHSYESSRNSMQRFKEVISDKSEKLRTLTLDAYELGEINLLNLLNAQQFYLDSRENYLNALRDYYKQLIKLEKYMNKDIVY